LVGQCGSRAVAAAWQLAVTCMLMQLLQLNGS
jgi:hypothetical protein